MIELPALDGRYFSCQVMDHYGDYFLEAGEPFTGTGARRIVLYGPGWTGRFPAAFNMRELIAAPSDTVWAILRVAVTDRTEQDLAVAREFLRGVVAVPLSDWQDGVTDPPPVPGDYAVHPRMPELSSLYRDATAADFFEILSLCLNDPSFTKRADSATERQMLAELAGIGLAEGSAFSFAALDPAAREAIEQGYAAGAGPPGQRLRHLHDRHERVGATGERGLVRHRLPAPGADRRLRLGRRRPALPHRRLLVHRQPGAAAVRRAPLHHDIPDR